MQTESFEGPFDLLLHLILKDDVDLYEVRLCEIVDAYLLELENIKTCDLDISTEFLLIASTLIELKCRRLLPSDKQHDLDEELGLWEERDMLLARLLECKTFKDASTVIQDLFSAAQLNIARSSGLEEKYLGLSPDPLAGMTAAKLHKAFVRVTGEKPQPEISLFHVAQIKVSVNEAIDRFLTALPNAGIRTFRSFLRPEMERLEVVVHFLALLEMFKQGVIELEQSDCFGDLSIEWIDTDRAASPLVPVDAYEG